MASTYTPLGVEKMATGENAGTWGTKTNTNLEILEQISGGYTTQAVSDSGDTTLSVTDGGTGATLAHRIVKFTGALTGARNVTVPIDVQQFYMMTNATTGSQAVTFKYVTGTGSSVAWTGGDTSTKLIYASGDDGTNPNMVDLGMVSESGVQTLTNKTLTTPKINTGLNDANGNESIKFTATSSAVNEFTAANAATGNNPALSVTGGDSNISLNLVAKGTGTVQSNGSSVKVAGKETIWVPAMAMYPNSTNGCANLTQVELTAGQPELKCLDFDASSDENCQFAVAFPKSWNKSTLMYQVFWTGNSTNTGNVIWACQAVAAADNDPIDAAFGTAITITDGHSGTANDLDVSAQSSALTVAGSPSNDEQVFFQLYRDANAGGDTFSADARLLGIKLYFATDLPNDAD